MTRPVDPAALETLAITLHEQRGITQSLGRRPSVWREISPEQRQGWRDEALKLIAEQAPPETPTTTTKAFVSDLPAGQRLATPFEVAVQVVLTGEHPDTTSPWPPHARLGDKRSVVSEDFRLHHADVTEALTKARKRNIKLMTRHGSDAYIDRSGDVRK